MRNAFSAVVLLAVALLAAGPANGQSGAVVRVSTNPIDSGAEVYYAQDLGFFAKAGIDAQIQPGKNGAAIAAAVAAGAIDVGYSDLGSLAKAHARGIDFAIVAPAAMWVSSAPVNVIMVAKDSPIRSARDLNGKVVAVPGLGTGADYTVRDWLEANGADLATIKFIELSYAAMPAAIAAGRIDAAHVAEPFIAVAKQNGRVLASADDVLGKSYLRTVWFANGAWAKAHPDLIAKFAAVMHDTARWANDKRNYPRSAAILVKYAQLDPSIIGGMTRVVYGESLDPKLLQPEIDSNAKYGGFTTFPAVDLLPKH
jgi:NitT/TauT family transport system substrate-binding protein